MVAMFILSWNSERFGTCRISIHRLHDHCRSDYAETHNIPFFFCSTLHCKDMPSCMQQLSLTVSNILWMGSLSNMVV